MSNVVNGLRFRLVFLLTCFWLALVAQRPVDHVNPFIGTSNYGATHPGAVLPAGMVSVCPFNVAYKKGAENVFEKDSEWHSRPYVAENRFLTGFTHVNLSGVGCPDLGSIILMPISGALVFDAEKYGSTYRGEEARPGYYANELDKYGIRAEMTATLRSGLSRYTFPAGESHILLNLGLGLTNETGSMLRIVSPTEVEGFKMIGTFCYNPEDVRPVYFVAQLSKAPKDFGAWKKMPKYGSVEAAWTKYDDAFKPYPGYRQEMAGEQIGAYFSFDTMAGEAIEVRVGISYVSVENARRNLAAEQPGWDFGGLRAAAESAWDQALGRIQLKGEESDRVLFYTGLYHLLLHPNILQDVNGEYPLMGRFGTGRMPADRNRYTVFSLWDTYRNVHPFLSLAYPDLQLELVRTMLDMYRESGWLPKWELLGMETNVMVGDPASPVLADTWLRGLRDFDVELAYEAMRKSALQKEGNPLRPGLAAYDSLGYIPEGDISGVWGTVSTTLEYNISDWNIAQLALALGKEEDHAFFQGRSLSYLRYFDDSTGMLRPRMADGSWLYPFNPEAGKNFEPVIGFVEGNAWQYRFYVPHDIRGLIRRLGGEKAFLEALQACFDTGNFDMANEPDITYPYLFNYVGGEAWRTQRTVRELLRKYFFNAPAGLPGNDDTGTLSTWMLYSMLGLYPDCPGSTAYTLTAPVFDQAIISLDERYYPGGKLIIETVNNRPENIYIERIEWNGRRLKGFFIDHQELVRGGTLRFFLTDKPRK